MPELLYNLELDAEELAALHQLLQITGQIVELIEAEEQIAAKVTELMEGRGRTSRGGGGGGA